MKLKPLLTTLLKSFIVSLKHKTVRTAYTAIFPYGVYYHLNEKTDQSQNLWSDKIYAYILVSLKRDQSLLLHSYTIHTLSILYLYSICRQIFKTKTITIVGVFHTSILPDQWLKRV